VILSGSKCGLVANSLIDWFTLVSSPYGPNALERIDQPFVPLNLVSAQESPVPLPKFQMTPRLKNVMFSGSKKRPHIYYTFLSKVPASESPSDSPSGPLWRETPLSRAFLGQNLLWGCIKCRDFLNSQREIWLLKGSLLLVVSDMTSGFKGITPWDGAYSRANSEILKVVLLRNISYT